MTNDLEQIRDHNSEIRYSPPLTDSPWFWVLIFSAVGLTALVAIQGKYSRRQAGMEIKYQANERIENNRAGDAESRPMSQPDDTLVPLWPVATVLLAVMLIAAVMLVRASGNTS